jgi:hypothetical protein
MEQLFKPIPDYAKRDGEIWLEHYSPSALETSVAYWVWNYCYLGHRRRDVPVGAPAPAGGAAHDAIQAVVCDGMDIEDAVAVAQQRLIDHTPKNDLDAEKVARYIDEMGSMVANGVEAMTHFGDIDATKEQVLGYEHPRLDLPIIGYADFCSSDCIIELKTKWSRAGQIRRDGSRGFSVPSLPKKPDSAHARQVAFYYAASGKMPSIVYINSKDYVIFNEDNCEELRVAALQARMEQLLANAFIRQNLLKISNDPKVLAGYCQPDWNDFRWDIGDEFLKEAKELWKL